ARNNTGLQRCANSVEHARSVSANHAALRASSWLSNETRAPIDGNAAWARRPASLGARASSVRLEAAEGIEKARVTLSSRDMPASSAPAQNSVSAIAADEGLISWPSEDSNCRITSR